MMSSRNCCICASPTFLTAACWCVAPRSPVKSWTGTGPGRSDSQGPNPPAHPVGIAPGAVLRSQGPGPSAPSQSSARATVQNLPWSPPSAHQVGPVAAVHGAVITRRYPVTSSRASNEGRTRWWGPASSRLDSGLIQRSPPDYNLRAGARTNADFGGLFCCSGPRTDRVVA